SVVIVPKAKFDRHVAALGKTGFAEAFTERCYNSRAEFRRTRKEKSDHRHRRLLRARRPRPRRRPAEQRDEVAPPDHSMTSSAMARTPGGIVRPSVLAVLRLMTNSNFVGDCTGRSPGSAPLRMRST